MIKPFLVYTRSHSLKRRGFQGGQNLIPLSLNVRSKIWRQSLSNVLATMIYFSGITGQWHGYAGQFMQFMHQIMQLMVQGNVTCPTKYKIN